jgi:Plasmid pRiA4b ORF-3-like protein
MSRRVFVLRADLIGFPEVRRTIGIREDQTLEDVHRALQAAFGWDDDHLYSFWLKGKFWAEDGSEYTHPFHAEQPNPLGGFALGPPPKSSAVAVRRLKLETGQRIAYLFDFGDEWRVTLTVREVRGDDGRPYPRLLESLGDAPPQYPDYDEEVA